MSSQPFGYSSSRSNLIPGRTLNHPVLDRPSLRPEPFMSDPTTENERIARRAPDEIPATIEHVLDVFPDFSVTIGTRSPRANRRHAGEDAGPDEGWFTGWTHDRVLLNPGHGLHTYRGRNDRRATAPARCPQVAPAVRRPSALEGTLRNDHPCQRLWNCCRIHPCLGHSGVLAVMTCSAETYERFG